MLYRRESWAAISNRLSMNRTCAMTSAPALAHHAHGFDALESSPGTLKRAIALCQPGPFLYGSVVLFDDIEILALTQTNSTRKCTFRFQGIHGGWIGWVLIHIDDPRNGIRRQAEDLLKEAFRAGCVALRREQEINALPCRIHGTIQILVFALHLYIGFIDTVAFVRALEM